MPRRLTYKKIKTTPGAGRGANVSVRKPHEEEAKVPVPNRFHKTVVNYPGCVMFVTGLIAARSSPVPADRRRRVRTRW